MNRENNYVLKVLLAIFFPPFALTFLFKKNIDLIGKIIMFFYALSGSYFWLNKIL